MESWQCQNQKRAVHLNPNVASYRRKNANVAAGSVTRLAACCTRAGRPAKRWAASSISSVIRLENEGKLRKVRLRGETGQVFNPVADVEALASAVEG